MAKSPLQLPNTSPKTTNSKPSVSANSQNLPVSRRGKATKVVRSVAISTIIILLLLVGLGVLYTWYTGSQTITAPITVEAQQTQPAIQRVQPAENVPVGVSVQSLTSPVVAGENVTITAKTRPYANCSILVEYNKVASTDSGLKQKMADDFGVVSWTWTVEPSAPVGKWPVKVTCAYNEKSGVVQADLEVKN